jgi:hypothetical protein
MWWRLGGFKQIFAKNLQSFLKDGIKVDQVLVPKSSFHHPGYTHHLEMNELWLNLIQFV